MEEARLDPLPAATGPGESVCLLGRRRRAEASPQATTCPSRVVGSTVAAGVDDSQTAATQLAKAFTACAKAALSRSIGDLPKWESPDDLRTIIRELGTCLVPWLYGRPRCQGPDAELDKDSTKEDSNPGFHLWKPDDERDRDS